METPGKPKVILKEYGRNIQNLVDYILTIDDREKRSEYARTLVELMRQLNPNIKEGQENTQKLWDHLYIMSNFKLDVESEYDMPEPAILGRKPMKVNYNQHNLPFRHYGRNIELLVQKAAEMEDPEERETTTIFIGRLMKRFYVSWNKDNPEDDVIIQHIKQLSDNKIDVDFDKIRQENLLEVNLKDTSSNQNNSNLNITNNRYNKNNGGGRKRRKRRS